MLKTLICAGAHTAHMGSVITETGHELQAARKKRFTSLVQVERVSLERLNERLERAPLCFAGHRCISLHVTGPSGVLPDGVSAFSACRELRGVQIEVQSKGEAR